VPGEVPSFSVVIRAYQVAGTIAGAVESALGQTVAPLEVIVVDDGSTDDLKQALAPHSGRIVLIHKDHGGAASAFNAGLRAACGDFVAILDADDVYEPERLEALGELARVRPDLDLLMTDSYLEAGGRVVGRFCSHVPFAVEDQRVAILERCFIVCPAIRRSSVVAVGGYDKALGTAEDWDCCLRLILAGAKAGLVDAPLYRYRLADESLTGNRPGALRGRVLVLEKARVNGNLRPAERATLERSLAFNRRRALLTEAEAALRRGDSDARRRSIAVVLGPGVNPRARLKAVAAVLAPRWAGRRLDAREAMTGSSRLQRGLPPSASPPDSQ
jgi:glycosyltransferase involved in cell wall biosynthesis